MEEILSVVGVLQSYSHSPRAGQVKNTQVQARSVLASHGDIKIDWLSSTAHVFLQQILVIQQHMKDLRKTATGSLRIARTERILAKMEMRRARRRRACTASSQGGSSHSLQRISYQVDFQVKTALEGLYYYCVPNYPGGKLGTMSLSYNLGFPYVWASPY